MAHLLLSVSMLLEGCISHFSHLKLSDNILIVSPTFKSNWVLQCGGVVEERIAGFSQALTGATTAINHFYLLLIIN